VTNAVGVGLLAFYNVPLNPPPTVSITSPGAGTINGGTVVIEATASDDGTVTQVEFFANGASLGTDSDGAPWQLAWTPGSSGSYALTARATDNDGATAETATARTVRVNAPPSVTIASPPNNATFTQDTAILIQANPSDSDGTIAQVQFFANGSLLGSAGDEPWQFSWQNAPVGSQTLTAIAVDNDGATSDASAPIVITVNAATETPTVTPGTPTPTPTGSVTPTPTTNPDGTLTLTGQSVGAPGSSFAVSGSNFTPNATIRLLVNGIDLGSVTTDGNGSFTLIVETQEDAAPGVYAITVAGTNTLSATFSLDVNAQIVTAPGGGQTLALPTFTYLPIGARP
jgi:hypothetical protein